MVIYLNESGGVLSVPASVPQGSSLRNVTVIAPKLSQTLVLKVKPPSQELLPDIICVPCAETDDNVLYTEKNVVYTVSIPSEVTQYAGRAEYQLLIYDTAGNVIGSNAGSFNITRGIITDIPDNAAELEDYTLEGLCTLLSHYGNICNDLQDILDSTQTRLNEIGDGTLTTVQQTLKGAINELHAASRALNERIDTVKNEHKNDFDNVVEDIKNLGIADENLRSDFETADDALNDKIEAVESIAKGANQAVSFADYQTMITALNGLPKDKYTVGQNVMIVTLDVPDLWVSNVADTAETFTYSDDGNFVGALKKLGSVQIGYFVLSALETQKVDLTEYAKTEEVNAKLSEKLDANTSSGAFRAYTIGTKGTQAVTGIAAAEIANTLAYRDDTGNFKVTDPTEKLYAANKNYVDTANANLKSELEKKIGTVESIVQGASSAVSFADYQTMVTALNGLPKDKYTVGQNVMIVTLDVPDLWVSGVADTAETFTYTNDEDLVNSLKENGSVKVGYFVLSVLKTQKVDLEEYVKTEDLQKFSKDLQAYATNADQNLRSDFETADSNLRSDFETADSNLRSDFEAADDALNDKIEAVENIAKGANSAVSFADYQTMITALNGLQKDKYIVGQNVMIVTLDVPDLWVSGVEDTLETYNYTSDEDFVAKLKENGSVRMGYFVLSALETQKVDLTEYAKTEEVKEYYGEPLPLKKGSGKNSVQLIGNKSNSGAYSLQAGQNNTNTGAKAIIAGQGGTNSGENSIMSGNALECKTNGTIIVGQTNKSLAGSNQAIFGGFNTSNAENNLIAGGNNTGNHAFSFMAGQGHTTTRQYQTLLGSYSQPTVNTLLAIGNGSSGAPNNAFEVLEDGTAKLGDNTVATNDYVDTMVKGIGSVALTINAGAIKSFILSHNIETKQYEGAGVYLIYTGGSSETTLKIYDIENQTQKTVSAKFMILVLAPYENNYQRFKATVACYNGVLSGGSYNRIDTGEGESIYIQAPSDAVTHVTYVNTVYKIPFPG